MKCKNCNLDIDDDSVFCEHCGAKVFENKPKHEDSEIKKHLPWIIGGAVLLFIGILIGLLLHKLEKNSSQPEVVKEEQVEEHSNNPKQEPNKVTDIDGNIYKTVKIGNQEWMAENLRTTRYADGAYIPMGSSTNTTTACRYAPDNNSNNVFKYGYLYNWPAVMHGASSSNSNPSGVQGICPDGWHMPSKAEWNQLTDYVSGRSEYVYGKYVYGHNEKSIAKALASTEGWKNCDEYSVLGNDTSSNNMTGFSVLPAGSYSGYGGFGSVAYFWSSTEIFESNAYGCYLNENLSGVGGSFEDESYGFSVRCVRD